MLRNARHTLTANIIQQVCAGALLLYLPNVLEKAEYAQIVFTAVLLSFIGFADGGISQAYSRVVPGLLAHEKYNDVKIWDATTLHFGLIFSSFYSVIIALIFYSRYENILHSLLLLPMPFIICWFSFHIGKFSCAGDFRKFQIVNTWRSLASLFAFPLVWFMGLTGFFISNLFAAIIALGSIGNDLLKTSGKTNWQIVKSHLAEGFILSLAGAAWMTLMNFSRFYASIFYKAEDIATYGIISTAAMSLLALVISVFLPVSVEIRKRHAKNELKTLEYIDKTINVSLPWITTFTIITIITAPFLFQICFPKYYINKEIITASILGISLFPFLTTYMNLLICRKQFLTHLFFILLSLAISGISTFTIDIFLPTHGAAYGQLIGIIAYTLILLYNVADFSDKQQKHLWQKQTIKLFAIYGFYGITIIIQ